MIYTEITGIERMETMKKYLWLILIVCVLLTCTLTVAAVSGTETPVVYLNGEVETAGDGSSASSPVKTLAAAYAVLNGGDGTIVLCGNISVSANKTDATANSAFSATVSMFLIIHIQNLLCSIAVQLFL